MLFCVIFWQRRFLSGWKRVFFILPSSSCCLERVFLFECICWFRLLTKVEFWRILFFGRGERVDHKSSRHRSFRRSPNGLTTSVNSLVQPGLALDIWSRTWRDLAQLINDEPAVAVHLRTLCWPTTLDLMSRLPQVRDGRIQEQQLTGWWSLRCDKRLI